jgi:hypothetical protein
MADVSDTLTALREEIIAAGLGRRPSEPGPDKGPPYPVVIESPEGAQGPGDLSDEEHDHEELVVSLRWAGNLTEPTNYDTARQLRVVVDVRYRSKTAAALRAAMGFDAALVARLVRPQTNYGFGFQLGTDAPVWCQQASVFGGGRIQSSRPEGFDDVTKIMLEVPRA